MLLKTPDEEKAARLLDEARALLKKHGWHTGSMGEVGDSHCLIGALREATVLSRLPRPASQPSCGVSAVRPAN